MNNKKTYEGSIEHQRFTVWMQKVIKNARNDYFRGKKYEERNIQIEYEKLQFFGYEERYNMDGLNIKNGVFNFADERVDKAFLSLTVKRRKILLLLYIEEFTPYEVAQYLSCSIKSVYDERYLALKFLRECLLNGGKEDE